MSSLPKTLHTAGKITILTSLIGVCVFVAMFLLNLGAEELQQVQAQGIATTSITVLNTPPAWTIDAQELIGSSTTTPTNSGSAVSWRATATDSNGAPYFLLVCGSAVPPTPNPAAGPSFLGTAAPDCSATTTQWAVASGTSGSVVTAATTTTEAMAESNVWFAWICDDDPVNPRCNATYKQGTGTTSSPFNVNHRPTFTVFSDDSAKLPGELVTFTSTASDADVTGTADTVKLTVCGDVSGFNTTTDTCNGTTLGTSTLSASNPTATYTISIPTRDTNYVARGYVIDNHGHEAAGGSQDTDSVLTVSNATPYVNTGDITLNDGTDIILTTESGETTGFELQFAASDNNSCETSTATDEIVNYAVSVFRTNVGTTSCDAVGEYNANRCYTSTVPLPQWNISCTASSTSCTGPTDMNMVFDCTFPLWYIADPTDGGATNTPQFATDWSAAVAAVDDDAAQGVLTRGSITQELFSFLAIALDTIAIPYGSLEPGDRTDPLVASTTMRATGNVGIDQLLTGEAMCSTYTSAITCPNSATSTIRESYQVFATSTVSYANATSAGHTLSSSTQKELEINVFKPTATSTQTSGVTYWGIEVPISITLAGAYTGENTFYGKVSEPGQWQ